MLSRKVPLHELGEEAQRLSPTYASRALTEPIPRYQLPDGPISSAAAYRLVHDELALDGNPALNLATFVSTWMEPEADQLMAEARNKNAIDWDEYPQTIELQDRCVNMLARLYNAPEHHHSVGTATVGSSEAIHLAGLAMKWRWRARRQAEGKDTERPNLVMGNNVQVVWEKFARYFEVEPRYVPLTDERYIIGVPEAMALVDERTIGVVGILGSTYTGQYEPIAELDAALNQLQDAQGLDVPIHVDAASGGFVAPFLNPELAWDFRLERVRSINVSGHKYGLVYPGVGWVVWRDEQDLPEDLVFSVNYLGGEHSTLGLNFSRGAAQIVAQYYNFIRLGWSGYRAVMTALSENAQWFAGRVQQLGCFELLSAGQELPVVCFRLSGSEPFSVFDISDVLRERGWIVPAYRMAPDAQDVAVLRVVVREGFSRDMANELLEDLKRAVTALRQGQRATTLVTTQATAPSHDDATAAASHAAASASPSRRAATHPAVGSDLPAKTRGVC